MNSQRALQLLTMAFLVIIVMAISMGLFVEDALSPMHRDWQKKLDAEISPPIQLTLGLLAIPYLILVIVGSVALLRMKRWGIWTHMVSSLIGFITVPLIGTVVQDPFTGVMNGLTYLTAGAIYGVAFFSDALPVKKKPIQES